MLATDDVESEPWTKCNLLLRRLLSGSLEDAPGLGRDRQPNRFFRSCKTAERASDEWGRKGVGSIGQGGDWSDVVVCLERIAKGSHFASLCDGSSVGVVDWLVDIKCDHEEDRREVRELPIYMDCLDVLN